MSIPDLEAFITRSWPLRHDTSVVCPGLVMYDLQTKASKLNQKHALRVCFMSILYITYITTYHISRICRKSIEVWSKGPRSCPEAEEITTGLPFDREWAGRWGGISLSLRFYPNWTGLRVGNDVGTLTCNLKSTNRTNVHVWWVLTYSYPRGNYWLWWIVPLPTLNDAIDALNGFTEDILNTLQEIVDIGAELEHKEHVRTDNLEEVTSRPLFVWTLLTSLLLVDQYSGRGSNT